MNKEIWQHIGDQNHLIFTNGEQDTCLRLLKSGHRAPDSREFMYFVVFEDAYQSENNGKTLFLSKTAIEKKFDIQIPVHAVDGDYSKTVVPVTRTSADGEEVETIFFDLTVMIDKKNEARIIDNSQEDHKDYIDCDTLTVKEVKIEIA